MLKIAGKPAPGTGTRNRESVPPMRVLQVASEATPFAKTGGLADVAGALPEALAHQGCDVTLVIPEIGRAHV